MPSVALSPEAYILGRALHKGLSSPVPAWVPDHSQPCRTSFLFAPTPAFSSSLHPLLEAFWLLLGFLGEFLAVMSGLQGPRPLLGAGKVNSVFVVTQTYYLLLSRCWRGPAPTPGTGRGHRNDSWIGSQPGLGVSGGSGEHMKVGPSDPQGREVWKGLS